MKSVFLLLAVCCSGCVHIPPVPHQEDESVSGVVVAPSASEAVVVFVRASNYGAQRAIILYDGDKMVGIVQGRNYAIYRTTPGKKTFGAVIAPLEGHANNHAAYLDAKLEAEKIYYVRTRLIFAYTNILTILEPLRSSDKEWQDLPEWLGTCKLTHVTGETRAWASGNAAMIDPIRKEYYDQWVRGDRSSYVLRAADGVAVPVKPRAP